MSLLSYMYILYSQSVSIICTGIMTGFITAAGSDDDNKTLNVSGPSSRSSERMVMLIYIYLTPLVNVRTVLTGT